MYDVVVVGGGPAGSTAAYYADKSLKVLIIDRFSFPRHKACGGGLLGCRDWDFENYAKIKNRLTSYPTDSVVCYYGTKRAFTRATNHLWDHVSRYEFDHLLLKESLKKSNVSFLKFSLKKIIKQQDCFVLSDGKSKIRARYLIGADGWDSVVSRFLGNRRTNDYGLFLGNDVECRKKTLSNHILFGYKEELGYACVFPTAQGYYIGFGAVGKTRKPLKAYLDELMEYCVDEDLIPKKHSIIKTLGAPVPIRLAKKWCSDKVMLCGDALGLVNQITGEGIYYAMLSGRIASQTISKQDAADFYRKRIRSLIKEVSFPKFPKFLLMALASMSFRIFVRSPLPKKIKLKVQNRVVNRLSKRNRLLAGSFYKKF